jgi:xanthine dehydrogenase accessory factor
MASDNDSALSAAWSWLQDGQQVALATVTRTWGSAPRPAGSQMAVRFDGAFVGSVSGGCVENAVIEEARNAVGDGNVRNLEFGVSNEEAWAVGLACGGTIEVQVVPVATEEQREILENLVHAVDSGAAATLAANHTTGEWRLVYPDEEADDLFTICANEAARRDQSTTVEADGKDWFLTVFNPPLELVVIGAVHIAQPLSEMAKLAGYNIRIIDPRTHFASAERFPGVTLVHAWADEALAENPLGARSALVALTHDPKLDDPALIIALRSPAFYVGALGSKKTHAKRLERLKEAGFSDQELERLHAPIGLAIGARSPAEIAISILAEITRDLRQG